MIWPALLLLTLLVCGYFTHRQAKRAETAEALATRRTTERDDTRTKLAGQAGVALDAEWLAICLATTEAERDTYRTAFTSLLANQARSELIAPEEPVGKVLAFERRTR